MSKEKEWWRTELNKYGKPLRASIFFNHIFEVVEIVEEDLEAARKEIVKQLKGWAMYPSGKSERFDDHILIHFEHDSWEEEDGTPMILNVDYYKGGKFKMEYKAGHGPRQIFTYGF